MKFYIDKFNSYYWGKIYYGKLISIYQSTFKNILFYKYGIRHNIKNAAYINNVYKEFVLNDKYYGNQYTFTKESWRRFVKLQAFL
jgi:hypothetical protein